MSTRSTQDNKISYDWFHCGGVPDCAYQTSEWEEMALHKANNPNCDGKIRILNVGSGEWDLFSRPGAGTLFVGGEKYHCGNIPTCHVGSYSLNDVKLHLLKKPDCFPTGILRFSRQSLTWKVLEDIWDDMDNGEDPDAMDVEIFKKWQCFGCKVEFPYERERCMQWGNRQPVASLMRIIVCLETKSPTEKRMERKEKANQDAEKTVEAADVDTTSTILQVSDLNADMGGGNMAEK
ncbi:hypothetical protein EDC01DRAFT_634154 [Geopyxis carbonaria]|nr:hypothetical protein EDC01DRAFT_634154 [Geopyxis carbonaria]